MRYYTGNIIPEDGTIFVFGSNPEGRHGAGSAKVAREKFGAIYGVGEGLQGSSYALPTKDLRIPGDRSICKEDIVKNIAKLYDVARKHPDESFKVAYRTKFNEKSLNGYTGSEMLKMFTCMPVPNNIWFSEEWYKMLVSMFSETEYVNHSGGAVGSDTYWGEIGGMYGVVSEHYWRGTRSENGNHEISREEFEKGKKHVLKANETLHRRPEKYMNLLARDYTQVDNSDEIFAIGFVKNKQVAGGTGWAVQMAIDDGKPVNLFDQQRKRWFRNENGKWDFSETPVLTHNFAGIGTRQLDDNGKNAIKAVYAKTFGNITI